MFDVSVFPNFSMSAFQGFSFFPSIHLQSSIFNLRPAISPFQLSTFPFIRCSMFGVGCSMFPNFSMSAFQRFSVSLPSSIFALMIGACKEVGANLDCGHE
jgi:hypothetical protein